MLSKILPRFTFVRDMQRHIEAAEKFRAELTAMLAKQAEEMGQHVQSIDELEVTLGATKHLLEVETAKRIAAEQIAVSRGAELEWLRTEYAKVQDARDVAVHEQHESLNLVNTTLLRQTEAEAPPTKEQMAEWRPITKRNQQPVPLMRQAQQAVIKGLRDKATAIRRANAVPVAANEPIQ